MKRIIDQTVKSVPIITLLFMLTAGFFLKAQHFSLFPTCWIKKNFFFDCPGCGLTRAFLLIPKGEWQQAFELNSMSLPLYFLFFVLLIFSLLPSLRLFVQRKIPVSFKWIGGGVFVFGILLNWLHKTYLYFQEQTIQDYVIQFSEYHHISLLAKVMERYF